MQFFAPETIASRTMGLPSDLWALGVLTYELLLGEPGPFGHDEGASPSRLKLRAQIAGRSHADTNIASIKRGRRVSDS